MQRLLRVQMDPDPPIERQAGFDQAASQRIGLALPLGEGQVSDVDHGEGRLTGELLSHPSQVLVHPHVCGTPQGARWRRNAQKLTPVSGSLQHGRCSSGGQSG